MNAKSDIVGHEVSLFPCEMMAAIWTRIKMEWSTINNCITIYDVLYGCELYNFSNSIAAARRQPTRNQASHIPYYVDGRENRAHGFFPLLSFAH